jgi:DNA polymerase
MRTQIPFTGGSGRLLDNAFRIAGLQKADVFITNVVHCHTPDNRKSLPHEIMNCAHFMSQEINLVDPAIIIPLGQDAIISILGSDAWPSSVGKSVQSKGRTVYPMYHPSYIMKQGKVIVANYTNDLVRILISENK